MWQAIGAIGGSLIGGLLSNKGSSDANEANAEQSAAARAFNAAEAEKNRIFQHEEAQRQMNFQTLNLNKQMDFAERMANSAVQRRMDDLKKAGINPILAGKYDADSPTISVPSGAAGSGSQASSPALIPRQNELEGLAHSARSLLPDVLKIQKAVVDINNAQKTGAFIDAQTDEKRGVVATQPYQRSKMLYEMSVLREQIPKMRSETERNEAQKRLSDIEAILKGKEVPQAEMKTDLMRGIQGVLDYFAEKLMPTLKHSAQSLEKKPGFFNDPNSWWNQPTHKR